MTKYIGTQEILQEEVKGTIVEATLKVCHKVKGIKGKTFDPNVGLGETEIVTYEKEVFDFIKSDKENTSDQIRVDSCNKVIGQIVAILMINCVKMRDVEYILDNVKHQINTAEAVKSRKLKKIGEDNWTVQQLRDELMDK